MGLPWPENLLLANFLFYALGFWLYGFSMDSGWDRFAKDLVNGFIGSLISLFDSFLLKASNFIPNRVLLFFIRSAVLVLTRAPARRPSVIVWPLWGTRSSVLALTGFAVFIKPTIVIYSWLMRRTFISFKRLGS